MNKKLIEKSQKDIPILKKYAKLLLEIAKQMENKELTSHETDHFGFICAFYFFKQVNHYNSVLQLVQSNQFSDATIIARVMLEGLIYLLWINLDKERRAKCWRAYALVSDYKLLLKNKHKGIDISSPEEHELINRIKIECRQYLTKNGKKSIEKGEDLFENSFRSKWLVTDEGKTIPIENIFCELKDNVLVELYSDMSDWVHWNPRGIGTKIEHKDGYFSFIENPPNDAATALASSFQALYQLMVVVNKHFDLKFDKQLIKIRENYIRDLTSKNT